MLLFHLSCVLWQVVLVTRRTKSMAGPHCTPAVPYCCTHMPSMIECGLAIAAAILQQSILVISLLALLSLLSMRPYRTRYCC